MPVLAKGQRTAPQGRSVLPGEPIEGTRLASLGAVDQLVFLVFACVHRTHDSPIAAERFTRRRHFLVNSCWAHRLRGAMTLESGAAASIAWPSPTISPQRRSQRPCSNLDCGHLLPLWSRRGAA